MSIIFDAMDQQKCSIPHFSLNAKSWKEQTNKVHMQYGAFLVHGHGARSFVVDSRRKKDADLWMSGLLAVLKELKEEYAAKGMSWPSTLYLQADNASDNKNLLVYSVCQMLRDMGIFKKVKLCFLPVGHTHEDVDACFGALSRQLAKHDGLTVEEVAEIWKGAWKGECKFKYLKVLNDVFCFSLFLDFNSVKNRLF